jgi:2-polyprenyl-3-methyl-5-hydroxy-6-metoxy-1,4-benzoquinol methylase
MSYYTNVNGDLLAAIPMTAKRVLEIGCGDGSFALAAKARNPDVAYFGVELFEEVGLVAQSRLDGVIIGNIEDEHVFEALVQLQNNDPFDVLVFGDVLEHLIDPWGILEKLRVLMLPQGICAACIPNIGHWSIVQQQLRGRWDYADSGLLDRTHLRFFTHETMRDMFTNSGWQVVETQPRVIWQQQTQAALKALEPIIPALGLDPDTTRINLSAFQWIVVASNGQAVPPIHVAALTIKKVAGVNEARIDFPLAALKSLPSVRAVWGEGGLSIPNNFRPGVLILHRQFVNRPDIAGHVERMIAKGWVVVSEMDDDPAHWAGYRDSNYIAFRGVHAVSVSTHRLAKRMEEFNPNISVFSNTIFELPTIPQKPSKISGRSRIFFGALNRLEDWNEIKDGLLSALKDLDGKVEFVVVHDRQIFDDLPEGLAKEFHPTLVPTEYLKVLGTCDVALLPLRDTPFNHLKSDIKLIECCATGVVPMFSNVVYSETASAEHCGVLLAPGQDWGAALAKLIGDNTRMQRYRDAGLGYVKAERMTSHSIPQRRSWLEGLLKNRNNLEAQRQTRLKSLGLTSLVANS